MEDQNTDSFETDEERELQRKLQVLEGQAHEGALFTDWKNNFCTVKMLKWLDEQIGDTRNRWLSAETREQAESVRLEAKGLQKLKTWINAQIGIGAVASMGIKEFHKQGVELEGLIKPPTRD